MANAESSDKNAVKLVAGLTLTQQSSNPIASGEIGLWADSSGDLKFTNSSGSVSNLGGNTSAAASVTVRAASTANIASLASASVTMDGVTLVENDLVLLKDQTTGSQNGIYKVGAVSGGNAPLTRASGFNTSAEMVPGLLVIVTEGTASADTQWQLTTNAAITLGTTSLTFARETGVVLTTATQTLTNKTLTSPVVGSGLTASGSGDNDFSASTGAFKTSTGANTLSGDTTIAAGKNISGAAGAGSVDFSSMTGTFDGPTGISTLHGDLLLGSAKAFGVNAAQSLSGAGAVDVTHVVTMYTSTGVDDALTLADGAIAGQLKIVHHTVDGGSGILTPATAGNFANFTFTAVHDACLLMWNGAAWDILLNVGGTIA